MSTHLFECLQYIDTSFNPEPVDYPYPADDINNITYDGLHLSDRGHGIITEMPVRVIEEVLVG